MVTFEDAAEELVQVIQQAQADGQPVPQRVAEKIHAELASSGFQIVDGQLVPNSQAKRTANTGDSLEVLAALDPTPGAQQRRAFFCICTPAVTPQDDS